MNFHKNSKRCQLFEKIAFNTWNHVIRNHRTKTQVAEIGVTNDIISEIKDNQLSFPNIGLWARNGIKENVNGSDLDIFVETKPGLFVWWALQAKVLKLDGSYDIKSKSENDENQWQKLEKLSNSAKCISRFLLYNGKVDFSYNGADQCKNPFQHHQFGCSLVKTSDIKKMTSNRTVKFEDFHPSVAEPWRVIVCCPYYFSNSERLFTSKELKESMKYFPIPLKDRFYQSSEDVQAGDVGFTSNVIEQFSMNAGWSPNFRIVVRTTSSLREIG